MKKMNPAYERDTVMPTPGEVELHLSASPEFSRFSGRVRAIKGRYSECRGNARERFVTLPWTAEGRSLANLLVKAFGRPKTTMIVRGLDHFREANVSSPIVVHHISREEADPCGALESMFTAAFLRVFPDVAAPAEPTGLENTTAWKVAGGATASGFGWIPHDTAPKQVWVGRRSSWGAGYRCIFVESGEGAVIGESLLFPTEEAAWGVIGERLAEVAEKYRVAAEAARARVSCSQGEPVACPEGQLCRHGIDG